MSTRSDNRTQYFEEIEGTRENYIEKKVCECAEEILQEFDSCFVYPRPTCEELSGNTIVCHEMDVFELYICVLMKVSRYIDFKGMAEWSEINIEEIKICYPYIEEIWNIMVKHYGQKTCSIKHNKCVFSFKIKSCEIKSSRNMNASVNIMTDLILCINKEELGRERRYNELLGVLCICSRNVYELVREMGGTVELPESVKIVFNDIFDNFHDAPESDIITEINNMCQKRYTKFLSIEDGLNRKLEYTELKGRIELCSDWIVFSHNNERL